MHQKEFVLLGGAANMFDGDSILLSASVSLILLLYAITKWSDHRSFASCASRAFSV
jgi:hypothetical protein